MFVRMQMQKIKSLILLLVMVGPNVLVGEIIDADVIIYGGTSAAVTAAVQVQRMGKKAVVVSPDQKIGGMSINGLGRNDTGKKDVIGGIAREFYHRVWRYYQSPEVWKWQSLEEFGNRGQGSPSTDGEQRTMWVYEPKVAEEIFNSLIIENNVSVFKGERLNRESGVEKENGRIISFLSESGNRFKGRVFIDCTYEGDLMAAAGVSYFVGRESNNRYGERLNGVQVSKALKNQFVNRIDPYKQYGDPRSGLLARISNWTPIKDGEEDDKIQAYNFRLCLTQVNENRVPFPKPDLYDPKQYELLLRTLNRGSRHIFAPFDPIPNDKTNTNNHGSFCIDNIGMNYDYPHASYEQRKAILAEHERYQKGYFYFLANDPRVPEDVRFAMSKWGLAKDEFVQNGHWPDQIYVREARRMIGKLVMNEHHLVGRKKVPRVVGIGSSTIASHNVQRYVARDDNGNSFVLNEGDFRVDMKSPCQISYDSLVPKKEECTNLLVPVCLSASHVAYGSISREPVFMVLGQSAATAAVLASELDIDLQSLPYGVFQKHLVEDNHVLDAAESNRLSKGVGRAPQSFGGVVVDGSMIQLEGQWTESSSLRPFVGQSYFHDGNGRKGLLRAKFPFVAPLDGLHEIKASFPSFANRTGGVMYEVTHDEGTSKILVDQRKPKVSGELWLSLGSFTFTKGEQYSVTLSNEKTEGYVVVDAIQVIGLSAEKSGG